MIICKYQLMSCHVNYCNVFFSFQGAKSCLEAEEEEKKTFVSDFTDSSARLQDPIRVQSVLRGFLLLTKQLHVFKESWARRRLGVEMFSTPGLYQQFVKLYRYCQRVRNSEDFITLLLINIRCLPVSVFHNQFNILYIQILQIVFP